VDGTPERAPVDPGHAPRPAVRKLWQLPIAYFVVVGGICAAIATTLTPGAAEVRATIRVTAFTSALPFLLAFVARPLHRLRRSAASRWLMINRRYVGLCVAASHWWHLVAIVALVSWYSTDGPGISPLTKIFGGGGFVMLGLMAATSNDASQRALGRGWRWLHLVGMWVVWLDFIFTYKNNVTVAPLHAVMTLLFTAALLLRIAAFRAR
jgi:DMSO/TMAO reductase YedYZ heme-binding membrane subunit